MADKLISDGARALRAFLNTKDLSVPDFCQAHRMDRIQVQKALNGDTTRISVDLATSIERATEGVVVAAAWREETRRMSSVEKKPRKTKDKAADEPGDPDELGDRKSVV